MNKNTKQKKALLRKAMRKTKPNKPAKRISTKPKVAASARAITERVSSGRTRGAVFVHVPSLLEFLRREMEQQNPASSNTAPAIN